MVATLVATPTRRILCWALLAWLVVRELQGLLTLLTLGGSFGSRLAAWDFWDGKFYVFLSQHGYLLHHTADTVYFPLYPMLSHLLLAVGPQAAALLVANLAALVAFVLVGLLVYSETGNEHAVVLAVLLLAVSPLGVFLSAMYADSLFLALAAGAILAARRRVWWLAGILLAAAVITRPFGIVLAIGLLVELVCQRHWRALPLLVIPPTLTLGAFVGILWHTFGSPFEVAQSEQVYWGHALTWPWQTIALTFHQFADRPTIRIHMLGDALPLLLAILCVILLARTWPPSFTVYVAGAVLLCLITPAVYGVYATVSDGRYLYAAAPLLLIPISCWLTRWPRLAAGSVLALSLALQLVLVVFELHGGWLV